MSRLSDTQPPGLLARILLSIATLALVITGFFFLTIALEVGAILALIIGVRLWWTLRKLKREMGSAPPLYGNPNAPNESARDALDGEYQVVERESGAAKLPPKT